MGYSPPPEPPRGREKKRPPPPNGGPGGLRETVRAALLSPALEQSIIAAGGLNGRVRDGNGCLTPAGGTNQGFRRRTGKSAMRERPPPSGKAVSSSSCADCAGGLARPRAPGLPERGGGRRPDLTADQKRYGERLAALAHPPCQTGGLPVAFRGFRPGRLISGGAWRLDAFSAYPFAAWPPGGALGRTTGTPEAARPRSSRTRGRSRQPSSARGG